MGYTHYFSFDGIDRIAYLNAIKKVENMYVDDNIAKMFTCKNCTSLCISDNDGNGEDFNIPLKPIKFKNTCKTNHEDYDVYVYNTLSIMMTVPGFSAHNDDDIPYGQKQRRRR